MFLIKYFGSSEISFNFLWSQNLVFFTSVITAQLQLPSNVMQLRCLNLSLILNEDLILLIVQTVLNLTSSLVQLSTFHRVFWRTVCFYLKMLSRLWIVFFYQKNTLVWQNLHLFYWNYLFCNVRWKCRIQGLYFYSVDFKPKIRDNFV